MLAEPALVWSQGQGPVFQRFNDPRFANQLENGRFNEPSYEGIFTVSLLGQYISDVQLHESLLVEGSEILTQRSPRISTIYVVEILMPQGQVAIRFLDFDEASRIILEGGRILFSIRSTSSKQNQYDIAEAVDYLHVNILQGLLLDSWRLIFPSFSDDESQYRIAYLQRIIELARADEPQERAIAQTLAYQVLKVWHIQQRIRQAPIYLDSKWMVRDHPQILVGLPHVGLSESFLHSQAQDNPLSVIVAGQVRPVTLLFEIDRDSNIRMDNSDRALGAENRLTPNSALFDLDPSSIEGLFRVLSDRIFLTEKEVMEILKGATIDTVEFVLGIYSTDLQSAFTEGGSEAEMRRRLAQRLYQAMISSDRERVNAAWDIIEGIQLIDSIDSNVKRIPNAGSELQLAHLVRSQLMSLSLAAQDREALIRELFKKIRKARPSDYGYFVSMRPVVGEARIEFDLIRSIDDARAWLLKNSEGLIVARYIKPVSEGSSDSDPTIEELGSRLQKEEASQESSEEVAREVDFGPIVATLQRRLAAFDFLLDLEHVEVVEREDLFRNTYHAAAFPVHGLVNDGAGVFFMAPLDGYKPTFLFWEKRNSAGGRSPMRVPPLYGHVTISKVEVAAMDVFSGSQYGTRLDRDQAFNMVLLQSELRERGYAWVSSQDSRLIPIVRLIPGVSGDSGEHVVYVGRGNVFEEDLWARLPLGVRDSIVEAYDDRELVKQAANRISQILQTQNNLDEYVSFAYDWTLIPRRLQIQVLNLLDLTVQDIVDPGSEESPSQKWLRLVKKQGF